MTLNIKPTGPNFMVWLLLFFTVFRLDAQNVKRYNGTYTVDGYTGTANFNYKLIEGDTILHGPFQFQRANPGTALNKTDAFFGILGSFENGVPNGYWKFQFGEFKSGEKSELVGFEYRVSVSGIQLEAGGNLKNGKPDGEWVFTEQEIKDSETHKTLFRSSITFENGLPQQSFRIENEELTLLGRFLRNGKAHDSWSCLGTSVESTENWIFNSGALSRIEKEDEDSSQVYRFPKIPNNRKTQIALNKEYLNILNAAKEDSEPFTSNTMALLVENAAYYKKINTLLNLLGEASFEPNMMVDVPYFPMDSLETSKAESVADKIEKSFKEYKALIDNSQLNLLKRSDAEVAALTRNLEALGRSFIVPLNRIAESQSEGVLSFLNREVLLTKLFPDGLPSTTLNIAGQGSSYSGPNADTFSFEGDFWQSVTQMTEYASLCLTDIGTRLSRKISNVEDQEELIQLENEMVSLSDSLKQRLEAATELPEIYKKGIAALIENGELQLAEYAKLKNKDARLEQARQVVACLNDLHTLTDVLLQLPQRSQEIKNAYQDDVWNPFMATIMKEDIKKRITSAYENVLLPYVLDTLTQEEVCSQVGNIKQLLDSAYEKVLGLRDEDTSKLERKLRREKNAETVIELFGLYQLPKDE
ncbi:hypothetical protein [Croceivirga thetidis]|uniref:Uncharacterized protein n=1 Tax=Croceivirga thetidis TaxID=2721623 RepID=A0ABX1GQW6_9FLAO|nr:hypothetical protein [Croceivirga thetidis]NKI32332.1 hypothetical protein [Croceivirga thetidis]